MGYRGQISSVWHLHSERIQKVSIALTSKQGMSNKPAEAEAAFEAVGQFDKVETN